MCPAHRQLVLHDVRRRLKAGEPCLLVSTQCVEAGVDVDFPVAFRAWGPLDAIAQAAGRCNRNGRQEIGEVRVFKPEDDRRLYPDGAYQQAASVAETLLGERGAEQMDIHDPALFTRYYQDLYGIRGLTNAHSQLVDAMQRQHFAEVASLYRVIEKAAVNVLVPYCPREFHALTEEVRETGLTRDWVRRARPHTIGMFRPRAHDPVADWLEPVPVRGKREYADDWFIYLREEDYHADIGLVTPEKLSLLIG